MNNLPRYKLYAIRYMSIENLTLVHFMHFRHFSSFFTKFSSTTVEDSLQIGLFMQNKPNLLNAQMNVSIFSQMAYKICIPLAGQKNKPNSNPIKPNCQKAKMNVNLYVIEDYRKKDDFVVRINKPNLQNGQNERKLTSNKGLQKKRLFSTPKNKPNSNPILSAVGGLQMNLKSLAGKSGHALVIQGLIFSLIRYSPGGIITPLDGAKKQRARRLPTTLFFSSVITEQKVGIIS